MSYNEIRDIFSEGCFPIDQATLMESLRLDQFAHRNDSN